MSAKSKKHIKRKVTDNFGRVADQMKERPSNEYEERQTEFMLFGTTTRTKNHSSDINELRTRLELRTIASAGLVWLVGTRKHPGSNLLQKDD